MRRIIRLLPSRQMALRIAATGRRNRQSVIVIDMAGCASEAGMPIRKKEPGRTVVKSGGRPTHSSVASRAIRDCECRWGRGMRRIVRLLPGSQVAP
jgi:hypothetical protein